jgi:O-acetylhomoserine (thiol)-lyase
MKFNTSLLHGGVDRKEQHGSTLPPIYQTSAFEQESAEKLAKIFEMKAPGYCYTRVGNPTVDAFEKRMSVLEGGIASIACASGMAALMNAFLNVLQAGDEIVTSASLYGGSIDLFEDLKDFGIKTTYVKNNDWDAFRAAITDHTKLIFAETIGNPRLDVTDIRTLADLAHEYGLPLMIDNTVATAYLVRPLDLGADVVINSTSKYINGSSDAISGVLTINGKFKYDGQKFPGLVSYKKYGPYAFTAKLRNGLFRDTGGCLAPQNAYLNQLGMETLGLRMERSCNNAYALAHWFEECYPQVEVNYPGLESSPWHELAEKQFANGYGAIVTLRAGSKARAFALIDALKLPYKLSNIGDTKTLVIHPASTISLHSTDAQREDAGVYEDLVRISVGIEDFSDLQEDFAQAMEAIEDVL